MQQDTIKFIPNSAILVIAENNEVIGVLLEDIENFGYVDKLEQMITEHFCAGGCTIKTNLFFDMNQISTLRMSVDILSEDEPNYKTPIILKTVTTY